MRKRRAELERLSSLNEAVSTVGSSSSSSSMLSNSQRIPSFQTPVVSQPISDQPAEELVCDGDDEVKEEFENVHNCSYHESADPCLTVIYGTSCETSTHLFHTGDPSVLKYIDNPMFQRNINNNRTFTVPGDDRRAVNTVEYIVQSKLQQLQFINDDGTSDDSTRTGLLGLIDSLTQELAALIESLQLSLTEKEMKVNWLEGELNTQRDALHTEIDGLKHTCSDKNDKLCELQKVEEQICATNRELMERIAVLDATMIEKDGFLSDITAQLHALTVRIGHVDTLLASKDMLIEDFRQQMDTLTASIAAQKIADNERQQQLQQELHAIQQHEEQLMTETKALTASLAEQDLVHANSVLQINELKETITQREDANALLLAEVTTSNTAIGVRDEQVKALDAEVSSLKHLVSAYEQQGEKYSAQLVMLKENMLAKEQQRKMAIQERDSLNDMILMRKQETVLLEHQVCESSTHPLALAVTPSNKLLLSLLTLSIHPISSQFNTHHPLSIHQVSQLTATLEAQSRQADHYLTSLDAVKQSNEELFQEKESLMVEINALRVSAEQRKKQHERFTSDITTLRESLQTQRSAETALLSQCQTLQISNETQERQRTSLMTEIAELKVAADNRERLFSELVESLSAAEQSQSALSIELER